MPIRRSFFRMWVFQWFLISLSVLPGSRAAILDHLPIWSKKTEHHQLTVSKQANKQSCAKEKRKELVRNGRHRPVAKLGVQVDDELLLVVGEEAALEVGPQVVGPPQPAALPAPQQPCSWTTRHQLSDTTIHSMQALNNDGRKD
jgi:hypothetical protein